MINRAQFWDRVRGGTNRVKCESSANSAQTEGLVDSKSVSQKSMWTKVFTRKTIINNKNIVDKCVRTNLGSDSLGKRENGEAMPAPLSFTATIDENQETSGGFAFVDPIRANLRANGGPNANEQTGGRKAPYLSAETSGENTT